MAQGWPANYGGVMLQGFYWDSYIDTQWSYLEKQSDELSQYFDLIWVPQSGFSGNSNNMGYTPQYYFNQNSSFGSEAQLRSMIKTFKEKGTGIIADVVINHRNNIGVNNSWVDFAKETYDGNDYTMTSEDIVSDDDGGATKKWAESNGYKVSGNSDTGEGWDGCRDIDHKSSNVNKIVKAYLNYLLNDLGYAGFRYDMVKGYSASYTGDYNNDSKPTYSVGEYWDGNASNVQNWMNGTKVDGQIQSGAFDFAFRYTCRDAVAGTGSYKWSALGNSSSVYSNKTTSSYSRYSVTFVENHDTEYRSATSQQDPIKRDTLALNAWMLGMPGTPCVFYKHWLDNKQEIKSMIEVRKLAGITNQSVASYYTSSDTKYYVVTVKGENCDLFLCVGTYTPTTTSYVEVLSGKNYKYLLSKKAELAWVDKASGEYEQAFNVKLAAVSQDSGAKVVYTLDGSEPSASNGTQAANGTKVKISNSCTLKVGLLTNGTVSKVITREYTIVPFETHSVTVYFKNPGWSEVYFYAWDSSKELLGSWPGIKMSGTKTIEGQTWYYKSFDITSSKYSFNIIFNQGKDKTQTVDLGPITSDTYYELGDMTGTKYTANDITSSMITSIDNTFVEQDSDIVDVYDISGVRVRSKINKSNALLDLPSGIYIVNGKKILKR